MAKTRDEVLSGIDRYRSGLAGFFNESWHGKDPVSAAFYAVECEEARAALLAAYDAQAAHIAELDAQNRELECKCEIMAYRHNAHVDRIVELEAACEAALPWIVSQIEYPGDPCEKIANGIRDVLGKVRKHVVNDNAA